MASKVHIVPHMHWDREWYFTTEESRILLVNNMDEIMEMLENNDDYPYYVMDGQTAILEDYFAVKPENKERVKALVQKGKLIIGPWYTQTDEMVVGGESIVRNLLYGIKDSKEFGEPMMIGYLPDSFGQSEKLPQILNGFDIDRCIFWRGTSERNGTDKHVFLWKSNSEGEVLVQLFPLGYAIGKYLPVEKQALKGRMDKYLPVLDKGAVTEDIILPNGHDQMPIQRNIFEVMEVLKKLYPERDFFLDRYESIFDELEKLDHVDTIQGELLDGKYMRVHRSIFSTRADIKSSNTRIENKLTCILEPLASLACTLGASYEHGLIEAIWKEIMKNHAHDSIGCCCSDKVHKAIETRFFVAEDKADALIEFYKRKIVDAMGEDTRDRLAVFNLLPYEREEVFHGTVMTRMQNFRLVDEKGQAQAFEILSMEEIDAGLIDRQIVHYGNYNPFVKYVLSIRDKIPAMGYKTYLLEEIEGRAVLAKEKTNGNFVENDYYKISVQKNGTLEIFDKQSYVTYKDILLLEDGADDGDEYDFSPLEDDFILTSREVKANVQIREHQNESNINISYTMGIPKDLDSRQKKVCDEELDVALELNIKKNSPIIPLQVTMENRSGDHRVRILVPNQKGTTHSKSDNQFGMIKRPVVDSAMEVWESEGWDERPDSIYPMLSFIGLDHEEGFSVLTNSVREFEIIGERFDTIAITLFRSVGYLGKEEMYRRPGRPSGIKMATPDSQMLGKHSYDIALVRNEDNLAKYAKEFITPFVMYNKMPYNAMKLNTPSFRAPYSYSWFSEQTKEFVLSTLKKAEYREGFLVRGYQILDKILETSFPFKNEMRVVEEVKLNEESIAFMDKDESLALPQNVVKTYYVCSIEQII